MLHPVTGDLYAIPESSVLFDAGECAEVELNHFLASAPLGEFTVERCQAALEQNHIIPVLLKTEDGAPRAVAWTTRLVVKVPEDEISDVYVPSSKSSTCTGHRFVFPWSFYHANSIKLMIDCQREQNGNSSFPMSHLDSFPASAGYRVSITGAGVTPADIPGATFVDMSIPKNVLSKEEAWFCSIIAPRETLACSAIIAVVVLA